MPGVLKLQALQALRKRGWNLRRERAPRKMILRRAALILALVGAFIAGVCSDDAARFGGMVMVFVGGYGWLRGSKSEEI